MPRKTLHAVIFEAVSRGLADAGSKDCTDVYLEEPITRAVEVAVKPFLAPSSLGRRGGKAKVPKGLATMSPEKREEIRAKALETRRAKARGHRCEEE